MTTVEKYFKIIRDGFLVNPFFIIACLAMFISVADAATFTYPGPSPCDTTLQACIDGASAGDIVEIATSSPIDESPELKQSLVLRAATGFTPTLAGPNDIWASSGGTTDNTFTIQGITLQQGIILVTHGSTGKLTATIADNTVQEGFITNPTISIRAGNVNPPVMGDIAFTIRNNRITVPIASQINGISVESGNNPKATGLIEGNTIAMQGSSQGAAINLANGDKMLTVDVVGNVISGKNFNAGVSIFQFSPGGTTTTNIVNNLITGQIGNAGAPAAISINGSQGNIDFSAINNTLTGNEEGLLISGRKDLGAVVAGNIANNIIANSTDFGLGVDSDFSTTVTNTNNLFYNNNQDFFTAGTGTVLQDPGFVGGGDYHLRPDSAAINSGTNTPAGGLPLTDLDGLDRIADGTVDIGAYENWATMPVPVGIQSFAYASASLPTVAKLPPLAEPIAVGPVASFGSVLRLQVSVGVFSGPVDLYFALAYWGPIVLPGQAHPDLYLLAPDNSLKLAQSEFVAWKTNVTNVNETLFGDIPTSNLPVGLYDLYLLATPSGALDAAYIWKTDFFIPFLLTP